MSRNFAVLQKAAVEAVQPRREGQTADPSHATGGYSRLIETVFRGPSAVAFIGSRSEEWPGGVCESIGAEIGAQGKRAVVVRVDDFLRLKSVPIPSEAAFVPGTSPNVWLWPCPRTNGIVELHEASAKGNWLDALRRSFDAVLLECPGVDSVPAVSDVALMADAAVIVVRAGKTQKQQIQDTQQALVLRGVNVAGCIFIRRK